MDYLTHTRESNNPDDLAHSNVNLWVLGGWLKLEFEGPAPTIVTAKNSSTHSIEAPSTSPFFSHEQTPCPHFFSAFETRLDL